METNRESEKLTISFHLVCVCFNYTIHFLSLQTKTIHSVPKGFVDGMVVATLRQLGDDPVGSQECHCAKDHRANCVNGKELIELLPRGHF